MATRQEVLSFIADFKGIDVAHLSEDDALGLSSLSTQRFRTALRRKFGTEVPDIELRALTVRDVIVRVEANSDDVQPSPDPKQQIRTGSLQTCFNSAIGIDIENICEFRLSPDPQADDFFRSVFTPAEIGYCLLQVDPAQHFAARFCAKEALRKCSAEYANLAFNQIQISNLQDGRPYYHIPHIAMDLQDVSLSLSHTKDIAIAVAVRSNLTLPSDMRVQPPMCSETTSASHSIGNVATYGHHETARKKLKQLSTFVGLLACMFVGGLINNYFHILR